MFAFVAKSFRDLINTGAIAIHDRSMLRLAMHQNPDLNDLRKAFFANNNQRIASKSIH
jgi:hypothetical protein